MYKLLLALSFVVIILGIFLIPKKFPSVNLSRLKPYTARFSNLPIISKPKIIDHYDQPQIVEVPAYTILFVGDSMTASLGENFDALRPIFEKNYPTKAFGLFNYGFGSTNLLSVNERLNKESVYEGRTLPAILDREFEIIIIESFGHNPLSQFPLPEGLQKQNQALDDLVAQLVFYKPNSLIIFLSTIPASQTHYGLKTVDLSPEVRLQWANERNAYIQNHITYAKNHNIPLIDVYQKSLGENGQALLKYINPDDYIHPSHEGVLLISQTIAEFLLTNNILPHTN